MVEHLNNAILSMQINFHSWHDTQSADTMADTVIAKCVRNR